MAAKKKKIKSKAAPNRPAPKPKAKAKLASKPVRPKAKTAAAPKTKAPTRAALAKPKPSPASASAPKPVAAVPPPALSVVRPGLQKRPDAVAVGVVTVTDGDRLIEESTFYSASGRDEYVQRWQARGYTCRFIPSINGAES